MTNKEIRKHATERIEEGKSRQEVFEELSETVKMAKDDLAKIIRFIPSLELRKKHKVAHVTLLILLGISVLFKMFAGIPLVIKNGINWLPIIFILPIINIILLYLIGNYRGENYKFVGIMGILGLTRSLQSLTEIASNPLIIVDFAFILLTIGLGFYLNSVMVPEFKTVKQKYTDENGKTKIRSRIKFDS